MNGSTNVLAIAGDISLFGVRAVTDAFRRPFEVAQIRRQLAEVGSKSLPLIVAAGFALGAVLTLHTRGTLVTFGATAWIPTVQALAFFVEIGPLVAGLLVAGRVGSGIGAVLSNMRATELLRGFFNKRGYYSLADISPEKYRRDGAFTKRSNRRLWLSGSELFQNGSNGEELSERGKAVLHAALTQPGEPFTERAIVIEGYANGGVPADQLRMSRSRAMAVRQYVQQQLELDPKNLGVVPMNSAPPKGVERATWDGVCIVVLLGS